MWPFSSTRDDLPSSNRPKKMVLFPTVTACYEDYPKLCSLACCASAQDIIEEVLCWEWRNPLWDPSCPRRRCKLEVRVVAQLGASRPVFHARIWVVRKNSWVRRPVRPTRFRLVQGNRWDYPRVQRQWVQGLWNFHNGNPWVDLRYLYYMEKFVRV